MLHSVGGEKAVKACTHCVAKNDECIVYTKGFKVPRGKTLTRCVACLPRNCACNAVGASSIEEGYEIVEMGEKEKTCCLAIAERLAGLEEEVAEL